MNKQQLGDTHSEILERDELNEGLDREPSREWVAEIVTHNMKLPECERSVVLHLVRLTPYDIWLDHFIDFAVAFEISQVETFQYWLDSLRLGSNRLRYDHELHNGVHILIDTAQPD